jgi:hypothetical protein
MITRGHRYRVRKGLQLPRFCVQPLQASRLAKAAALPVTVAAVCLDPWLTNFLQLADHAHFMERFRSLVPFFNSARLACAGTRHPMYPAAWTHCRRGPGATAYCYSVFANELGVTAQTYYRRQRLRFSTCHKTASGSRHRRWIHAMRASISNGRPSKRRH